MNFNNNESSRGVFIILLIISALGGLGFVVVSTTALGPGFPLDDAWIYQTYARNLVQYRSWVYVPGDVAGGATGPLWVLLLALGRLLSVPYLWWAYLIGILINTALGYVCYLIYRHYFPRKPRVALLGSVLVITDWHLIWTSVSGMETILFILFVSVVFYGFLKWQKEGFCWWVSLLIGIGVWVRPEAITLLLPMLLIFVAFTRDQRLRRGLYLMLGLGIPIMFYLAFNLLTSGAIFPTTYFAKQTEYAVLRTLPLVYRLTKVFSQPLIGVGAVLLPTFAVALWYAYKIFDMWVLSAAAWIIAFLGMYSIRLPVIYQHGRYEIPVIPLYLIIGWLGFNQTLSTLPLQKSWSYVIGKSWQLIVLITSVAFVIIGANAYKMDVAVIESEMVQTAKWIADNTDSEAIIAAHDIGAIGYFSNRQLIDLAGLISSDVVPIIRNESALRDYLENKRVEYIATFPSWYHELLDGCALVYRTNAKYSVALGGENMALYSCR